MENKKDDYLFKDPAYVQGQILALRSLILGLAESIPKEEFQHIASNRLYMLKTSLLDSQASDLTIAAVDHYDEWLKEL